MNTPHGGARPSSSPASAQRRQRIADATLALLRERDAAKITVADIAEAADVSVATVYNLVGPRERVLSQCSTGMSGDLMLHSELAPCTTTQSRQWSTSCGSQ